MSRYDDRDRGGRDRDDRGRDDRGRDRDSGSGRDRGDSRGGDRGRDDRDRDRGDSRGSRDRDDRSGRDRDERGSGSSSGFQYRQRSAEEVKERGAMGAREYDKMLKAGVKVWSPGEQNRIRILPPTWEGAKHYGLDVYVHYGVGPDRESYICPLQHGDSPCPICKERDEARRENNPDEDYVKELEAKRRVLVYVIDRDNEKEGVQAWMMPWTVDKDITKVSVDRDSGEVLPIDHPKDGFDVMFDKTGKGRNTKYEGVTVARRPSDLGKSAWLDHAMDNPLPDQLKIFDFDHIAKTFGAQGQQRDSRDRGDDRGGRDDRRDDRRDDDRGRDRDRDAGSRDRGDDRGGRERDRGGDRARERDDEPTWDSVHKMTWTEMEDLVELKALPIKPKEAKDEDDLADWICDELKLKKEEARERRSASSDDAPSRDRDRGDSGSDRLRDMRRNRAD